MTKINPVRKSADYIMKRAKHVKINPGKIAERADVWVKEKISVPGWQEEYHFVSRDEEKLLDYLILLDGLNFCFWALPGKKKWHITYGGKKYNGYYALSLSLKRFFEENSDKASLRYFSGISFAEFSKMLSGEGDLQFLKKRWQTARELSSAVLKKGGSIKFVRSAKGDISKLVAAISKLPSFGDFAEYGGKKVAILKRAQILAGDIYGAFYGKGIGVFKNLEYLTAFADYKLPQILEYWGIMEYSPTLRKKLAAEKLLKAGSAEEVEFRAATILSVELLQKEFARRGLSLLPYQIDWVLWNVSHEIDLPLPYPKVRTVFY